MKKLLLGVCSFFMLNFSYAEQSFLKMPNNRGFVVAEFPCQPNSRSASSSTTNVTSLQCLVGDESNFCTFLLSDSDLDMAEFNKNDMRWIQAIHDQYAKSLGLYKTTKLDFKTTKLGKSLEYEIYAKNSGRDLQVNGTWTVHGDRLLRIATICYPIGNNPVSRQKQSFLNSMGIVK